MDKNVFKVRFTLIHFNVHYRNMVTLTILQHFLQNCYCECDHFVTVDVKGLIEEVVVVILTLNMFCLPYILYPSQQNMFKSQQNNV